MNAVRRKKLIWVAATLAGAIIAVLLVIYAIGQQTDYYFDPTAFAAVEPFLLVKPHKTNVFVLEVW